MKKLVTVIVAAVIFSACSKPDTTCNYNDSAVTASASEVQDIKTYLNAKGLTATQGSAGFFYSIATQGSGASIANLCTTISVTYSGKLTNGTVFDAGTTSFQLGKVIVGWQKGMPLINKGGKITLYIPPSLGYGNVDVKNNNGVVVIPANSILVFDIELLEVSNR